VEAGQPVPSDLVNLLGQERFLTALRLNFSVSEDILLMPPDERGGFIGKGDLLCWKIDLNVNDGVGYSFNEHVSWLFVHYWYGVAAEPRTGSEWIADARVVYMGSFASLTAEQRQEFIEKVRAEAK